MEKRISLNFGSKKISLKAQVVKGFQRGTGLMFSRREKAKILLFPFKKPGRMAIHSLFVFFPFLAVWLDSDGRVMEIREVKPFSGYVCPKKDYTALVEIPLARKYKKITDGIEKFK